MSSADSLSTEWSEAEPVSASTQSSGHSPAPFQLLDDGFAPPQCDLVVIGCGNLLRGDDAVGPLLIRQLHGAGVPAGVRLVDGGTAGMDAAFAMRGARAAVIVDAANTGAEPGTIYRVPAEQLTQLPPLSGLHSHNFRWDHALAFADWLLGPQRPQDVTVLLVEGQSYSPGAALSAPVADAVTEVINLLYRDFPALTASGPGEPGPAEPAEPELRVEISASGSLHLDAALSARYFPGDALVAVLEHDDHPGTAPVLVLMPLHSAGHGGLVMKQRNTAGERSVLINEVIGFVPVTGRFGASWNEDRGALLVRLDPPVDQPLDQASDQGDR